VIPGPIGSVLEPGRDAAAHASLPFACTLCGSCGDVCPVKVPLPRQLLAWRGQLAERGHLSATKRFVQRVAAFVLNHPRLYNALGALGRAVGRRLPRFVLRANAWGRSRELPELPRRSFRAQWARRHDGA
jgi:L-lactate dehydrogenase complex protein LldF